MLKKQGSTFWKCWKSKFEPKKHAFSHVDGTTDASAIADHFAQHFSKACTNLTDSGADKLKSQYEDLRPEYYGMPDDKQYKFDAELLENIIVKMKRGKAAGLDGLTAEHLQYCHAILPCILAKLFNIMMHYGHVPESFGLSYTVPIHKGNCNIHSKTATVDDFRGISISPVFSKVFEHCILDRYSNFFVTSNNQFGFKKQSGCGHAIYTLRCVVNNYVSSGSTVNMCAIDLTKAYDKMNHHGLFIKLMEKRIPTNLLTLLENWFKLGYTCVKWGSTISEYFQLACGIRQGGVLSPYLFAVFIDSVVSRVRSEQHIGCYIHNECFSIILYADDIILLSPSVSSLQQLLHVCELELQYLDMAINAKKTACMRIGPRFKAECVNIVTNDGRELKWVDKIRYLGVYLVSANIFTCCYSNAKKSFYKAFNAIFGKVGRTASADVALRLVQSKCLPAMLYGIEACPVTSSQTKSLDFAVTGACMKIFCTKSKDIVTECIEMFDFPTVSAAVVRRKSKFLAKYSSSTNALCNIFSDVALKEFHGLFI